MLPDENQAQLRQLADDITASLRPTDASEIGYVERIIVGTIRQIRLRDAEVAKLRISMSDHVIAERIESFFRHPLAARPKSEHISDQSEEPYRYFEAVLDEYENYIMKNKHVSLLGIQANAPYIYELMTSKAKEYSLSWEEFAKDKIYIARALEAFNTDEKDLLNRIAKEVTELVQLEELRLAHERCEMLENDEKVALWSLLDSRTRSALKKYKTEK